MRNGAVHYGSVGGARIDSKPGALMVQYSEWLNLPLKNILHPKSTVCTPIDALSHHRLLTVLSQVAVRPVEYQQLVLTVSTLCMQQICVI